MDANVELARSLEMEAAVDAVLAACNGDARETIRTLVITTSLLEEDLEEARKSASFGFARGKIHRDETDQSRHE